MKHLSIKFLSVALLALAGAVWYYNRMLGYLCLGAAGFVTLIVFLLFCAAVIVGIIMVQQGQRRIPVQYAKRVVGRKMYGGQATHIPLKVNQAGVIPVIFAISLLQFPTIISSFFKLSHFTQRI